MIRYKFNVLDALKDRGYSTYRLRKEKLIGELTIQQLRKEELVSWKTIDTICGLLECQPGDLVEHMPNNVQKPIEARMHSQAGKE